jgi:hypothetical protein
MKIEKVSLAFSLLAFLALAYIFFPESVDDAYITLRFSKNLILGNGPIFNIGERVEGYSNFSWMVLLAAFGWVGIPMEMAMKFLSLASGLGVLALVWKLSANYFKSELAISTSVILLGFGSFFAVWAVDGLETMFYTMLLTSLVYTLTTDKTNTLLIGIVASLVALTRPEGIMFSLIAVGYLTSKKGFLSGLKALALVAVFAGGYELFRIYYFGQFVSNTALAKVHPNLNLVLNGLRYPLEYNAVSGYLLLPAALVGAAASKKNARLRIPIIFILAQIFFLMVSGGDFMYAYRFIIPVVPCIVLLCASAVDILYERVNRTVVLLIFISIVTSQAFFQYYSLPEKHIGFDNLTFRTSTLFTLADFLAQRSEHNDWIMLSEAGIVPFYVDAKIMDNRGLVSPLKSIFNASGVIQSDYLYSVRPKFIIVTVVETENGRLEFRSKREFDLAKNPNFTSYRHVRNFDIPKGDSFLNAIYYKYLPQQTKRVFFAVFERTNEISN